VRHLVETKPHSSLITLKALMLKTLPIIIKIGTAFDVGPIICVSSANERKAQVRWATAIGQKT